VHITSREIFPLGAIEQSTAGLSNGFDAVITGVIVMIYRNTVRAAFRKDFSGGVIDYVIPGSNSVGINDCFQPCPVGTLSLVVGIILVGGYISDIRAGTIISDTPRILV